MDPRFLPHNSHRDGLAAFGDRDPQLRSLASLRLVHHSPLIRELPRRTPGIYSLGGGRQVGKTTVLKQWMAALLREGVPPASIVFLTGEIIDDHHTLVHILAGELAAMPGPLNFVVLDEVTYIRGWDRAIKYLADSGALERTVLILTGSDLGFLRDLRVTLPGRRGPAATPDFHLYPLSFLEALRLDGLPPDPDALLPPEAEPDATVMGLLFAQFERYLIHGGYLTAMNDLASAGEIRPATLATYHEWVRGDMLKRGKREAYLREILGAIVHRYGTQVSWNALAQDLSIDHPRTVADYVEALATMDAVFIQPAILEDKLVAAPKKPKKIVFTDPFIFHAIRTWLTPTLAPYHDQILPAGADPHWCGRLAEACVATHLRRSFPTYHLKAEGEVDMAVVRDGRLCPIEVKWTGQIRPKDLRQIRKYPNGVIWGRVLQRRDLQGTPVLPLPLALARLG
ncbi:MAG: ATP-binding protein [Thermodesulfobacteriota bacterium]